MAEHLRRHVTDGAQVLDCAPCPRSRRPRATIKDSILDAIGDTPLVRLSRLARRADAAGRRQGRDAQPRRLDQGPRRGRADRGRRARRQAAPRRDDRRADLGQHRHRPGHRRAAEGLPRHRGHARQDVQARRSTCCAPTAPRSSSPRRPCRPTRPSPTTASPTAWPRRSRAPSSPTSTSTRPTRAAHYASHRARALGADRRRASPTSSPASARAARSPAPARYLKERNPDLVVVGADPVRLDLLRRRRSSPYLVEGVGEDFWPATFDPSVVDR